ncbi:MAG: hypothetical protein GY910_02800 [bacterium]|nr:hypothetical protein [Deltaproteobacteria bacterium]MCP4903883.1 hypothetical protein [bacterium]
MSVQRSFCRLCHCGCPIEAEIEEVRVSRVRGVPGDPVFRGHTRQKGREYPALHADPERLVTS